MVVVICRLLTLLFVLPDLELRARPTSVRLIRGQPGNFIEKPHANVIHAACLRHRPRQMLRVWTFPSASPHFPASSCRKQEVNFPFRLGQPASLPVQDEVEPLGPMKLMGA